MIFLVALSLGPAALAHGYERPTHQALAAATHDASLLARTAPDASGSTVYRALGMNPFPAEGELPLPLGLLEFTPPNLDEPLDARKLQEAGAYLEDNRFPLVRSAHHFFDPQNDRALTPCVEPVFFTFSRLWPGQCEKSPDWALEEGTVTPPWARTVVP